jgi:hypothetical protein
MYHSEPRSVFERGEESAFFGLSCEQQIPHRKQRGFGMTSGRFAEGCLAEEPQGRSTGFAAWIPRLPSWQSATDSEINSRLSEGKEEAAFQKERVAWVPHFLFFFVQALLNPHTDPCRSGLAPQYDVTDHPTIVIVSTASSAPTLITLNAFPCPNK